MFATLEAKVLAVIAVLAMLGAAFGAYTIHERNVQHAKDIAAVKESSDKVIAAATAHVADLNTHHAAEVAAITETFNAQHKVDLAQSASDAVRLRQFDALRRQSAGVRGAASGPANQATGNGGAVGNDALFSSLEQVAGQLAGSVRDGATALNACMADRDKLTGK